MQRRKLSLQRWGEIRELFLGNKPTFHAPEMEEELHALLISALDREAASFLILGGPQGRFGQSDLHLPGIKRTARAESLRRPQQRTRTKVGTLRGFKRVSGGHYNSNSRPSSNGTSKLR